MLSPQQIRVDDIRDETQAVCLISAGPLWLVTELPRVACRTGRTADRAAQRAARSYAGAVSTTTTTTATATAPDTSTRSNELSLSTRYLTHKRTRTCTPAPLAHTAP
jgi:hypothetical protein